MTHNVEPLLRVRDLHVSFRLDEGMVRAVDGVSFDVFPRQVVGIVGESGCGKSVTMRAVLQLIDPPGRITAGEIIYRQNDRAIDLTRLSPRSRLMRDLRGAQIALIPQEPMAAFSPVHTVGAQIVEAIMLHERVSRAEARSRTVELFRDVGISMAEQRVDAYSWQLSGGLRQRAMIAMALSCKPRLLIADEPTTSLDLTIQAQYLNLLRELQKEHGLALIFITHNLGIVAKMCDKLVVMYAGRVVESGPVSQIFNSPAHPYTQALLSSIPRMSDSRQRLTAIDGQPPDLSSLPKGCSFAARCPAAFERCHNETPPEFNLEGGRTARCWLASVAVRGAA